MHDNLYRLRTIIPATSTVFNAIAATIAPPSGAIAWYNAYTNVNLTVNTDGTGGPPADGGTIGRINDLTGNGNHLTPDGANQNAIFRSGYGINCIWDPDGTITQSVLGNLSFTATPVLNCSGGIVIDMPGTNNTPLIDIGASNLAIKTLNSAGIPNSDFIGVFNGATTTSFSPLRPIGRKMVLTWRSNSTNLILRVNGQEVSVATPISSATATRIHFATFNGGLPKPARYYEMLVYNTDIGESNIIALENYLTTNIGTYDSTRTVISMGDSLAYGVGSNILKSVFDTSYISNRSNSLWYLFNGDGDFLFAPSIDASEIVALKGSNEGVVVLWIGTNDIHSGAKTGAQTESNLNTYCTTLKNGGCKVIVSTLQAFVANNAERLSFNSLVSANFASYADALVDLAAQANLSDSTNTTYFETDGVHLTDAGYAIAASLYQTALASI